MAYHKILIRNEFGYPRPALHSHRLLNVTSYLQPANANFLNLTFSLQFLHHTTSDLSYNCLLS